MLSVVVPSKCCGSIRGTTQLPESVKDTLCQLVSLACKHRDLILADSFRKCTTTPDPGVYVSTCVYVQRRQCWNDSNSVKATQLHGHLPRGPGETAVSKRFARVPFKPVIESS